MKLPQEAWYDWEHTTFHGNDMGMAVSSLWEIGRVYLKQLEPLGVDMSKIGDGLRVEFVDHQTVELRQANALGLSYLNRNVNLLPTGMSRTMFSLYSGVISMELAHTYIHRLTGSNLICNDLVHWLYNESHLIRWDFVSASNLQYYGGSLLLVIPDLAYGWVHQKEIMDGIKTGKYKSGVNAYWTVSDTPRTAAQPIAAEKHELEHIKNFLIYGKTTHEVVT